MNKIKSLNNFFFDKSFSKSFFWVASVIFFASIFFRIPTFFVDYYDVDELSAIVQAKEYLAGGVPEVDFVESKMPLYHLIFKAAYKCSYDYGWVVVHIIAAFIVFFTSLFIMLTVKEISNLQNGFCAGILYAVLISSFNRHFMAVNGEIVYNLPVIASFYFFILSIKSHKLFRKIIFMLAASFVGFAAVMIKFHGLIIFIFYITYFFLYLPYLKIKHFKKFFYFIAILLFGMLLIIIVDYFTVKIIADFIKLHIKDKLFYAFLARSFRYEIFFGKLFHRQGLLAVWHFVVWIPVSIYIYHFIRNRFIANEKSESALALFFIMSYLLIFAGGTRLYFHYYMTAYPALCAIVPSVINKGDNRLLIFIREKFIILLIIPGLFFFSWNMKDAVIRNFAPQCFWNEGSALYWTRAVLTGHFNDYLLPEKSYAKVTEYINHNTLPDDRIFVWGNGAYIYYFSGRLMGTQTLWPQNRILKIEKMYKKNIPDAKARGEWMERFFFLQYVEKKQPVMFIDMSENALAKPTMFDSKIENLPLLNSYFMNNYVLETIVDNAKIYRKK